MLDYTLSTQDAANLLGVGHAQISNLVAAGDLVKRVGGRNGGYFYSRAEVEALVMRRKAIVFRCPRCEAPVAEHGSLCEDCLREMAAPEPEPVAEAAQMGLGL